MSDDQNTQDEQDRTEDVEAHASRVRLEPAEAADVEAHRRRFKGSDEDGPAPETAEREQPADADDDVEAHRRKFR